MKKLKNKIKRKVKRQIKKQFRVTDKEIIDGFLAIGTCISSVFCLFVALFESIASLFKKNDNKYLYKDVISYLYKLTPTEFEYFCAEIFKQLGYKDVKVTKATNDFGRDIVMKDKNGETVFVECKYYNRNNLIGREICQKLLGSLDMFGVDKGIIITTSTFHRNALEVKRLVGKRLKFIDINELLVILKKLDNDCYRKIIMKTSNIA